MLFSEILQKPWWLNFFWLWVIILGRYALLAGIPYFVLFRFWKTAPYRIDLQPLPAKQVWREFLWSVQTAAQFALGGLGLIWLWGNGYAVLDSGAGPYGFWYLPLNFVLLVILHETYFYFTHRLLHRPALFRFAHYVHHQSKNPTPFAAFAFHPLEALVEAIALPMLALVVPSNLYVFLLFLLFMSVLGVTNHLGFEFYPRRTAEHWFGRWWIGAVHHQQHHRRFSCNFGLYFSLWDRLMGTQSSDYEAVFREVKARHPARESLS